MLISRAIAAVQFRLGNRRDLEEKVRLEFNLLQEEMEQSGSPYWYLFQRDVPLTTVAAQATVAYPASFIQFYDYESVRRVDQGISSFLESDVRSLLLAAYPGSGVPAAFFDSGQDLEIFPTPDGVYTLYADCYIGEPDVYTTIQTMGADDAVNKHFQFASDYLIAACTHRLATSLNNKRVADTAMQDMMLAKQRLMRKHTQWEENNLSRNMGDTR